MTKIGVIADTHIPSRSSNLPDELIRRLRDMDMIIHAGDCIEISILQELESLAPTRAVCGNMDTADIRDKYPVKQVIEVEGHKIGIIHRLGEKHNRYEHAKKEFSDKKIEAVIFGHSHAAVNEVVGNILFFNPGSPTDELFAPYKSFGIITVDEKGITGEIIKL